MLRVSGEPCEEDEEAGDREGGQLRPHDVDAVGLRAALVKAPGGDFWIEWRQAVNLEVDLIARYLERLLAARG